MTTAKGVARRFKAVQKENLIREVNKPKGELLSILMKMENTPGCTTAANQLASMVARLEDWQNRHMPKK